MKSIRMKSISVGLLLITLMVTMIVACTDSNDEPVTESPTSTPTPSTLVPTETVPSPQPSSDKPVGFLEVVYFHRANRCSGCIWAEDATTNTLNTYFVAELENGNIQYKILNLQDDANAELVDKYDAHSSSLFINEVKGNADNIEEITGIWTKLHRDDAFTELVKTSIEEHLGNL